jgi:hypothetical protein
MQTLYSLPGWLDRCCTIQTALEELRLFWNPKSPSNFIPPRGSNHEEPLRMGPSRARTGPVRAVGQEWEAGSWIFQITFATELIIVTLVNSPWPREAHLL